VAVEQAWQRRLSALGSQRPATRPKHTTARPTPPRLSVSKRPEGARITAELLCFKGKAGIHVTYEGTYLPYRTPRVVNMWKDGWSNHQKPRAAEIEKAVEKKNKPLFPSPTS
jgi:hypothetical protein